MKGSVFIMFICLFGNICSGQELLKRDTSKLPATIAVPIIDTILESIWKGFELNIAKNYTHYNDRIRIIDLSRQFDLDVGTAWYYRKIPVVIYNKMPLNINNGEHRDVILNECKLRGDTLSINVFFCAFQLMFGNIRPPFFGTFTFRITGNQIRVIKSDISDLCNLSGYIEGWE
mgnify:CR=1 FL=1